jgi:hypothetical protein
MTFYYSQTDHLLNNSVQTAGYPTYCAHGKMAKWQKKKCTKKESLVYTMYFTLYLFAATCTLPCSSFSSSPPPSLPVTEEGRNEVTHSGPIRVQTAPGRENTQRVRGRRPRGGRRVRGREPACRPTDRPARRTERHDAVEAKRKAGSADGSHNNTV